MGGMPDIIVKPNFLRALDRVGRVLNGLPDPQRALEIDKALEDLLACNTVAEFVQTAENRRLIVGQAGRDHIRLDWLGERWWSYEQIPVQWRISVLRQAFVLIVELIRDTRRPLDSYWICAGSQDSSTFEATVAESPQQITLILHTAVPPPNKAPEIDDRRLWVVREDDAAFGVITRNVRWQPSLGA